VVSSIALLITLEKCVGPTRGYKGREGGGVRRVRAHREGRDEVIVNRTEERTAEQIEGIKER
jgi:hypothetical protein